MVECICPECDCIQEVDPSSPEDIVECHTCGYEADVEGWLETRIEPDEE